VKAAMQRVLLALHRREAQPLYDETARMVMQMHDELVFEVKRERMHEVAVRRTENCRNSCSAGSRLCSPLLSAPLIVSPAFLVFACLQSLIIVQMESENKKKAQEFHLRVPLVVRTKIGVSWGSLVSWTPSQPLPV